MKVKTSSTKNHKLVWLMKMRKRINEKKNKKNTKLYRPMVVTVYLKIYEKG